MTNCKLDNCRKQAQYHLAYGCINQHVADTTVCKTHLETMKNLVHQQKFRCSQCPKPIISGRYQPIHTNTKKINIKNLYGQTTQTYNNPQYTEPSGHHKTSYNTYPPDFHLNHITITQNKKIT